MEAVMVQVISAQTGMQSSKVQEYISAMTDEEITEMFTMVLVEQYKMGYAQQGQAHL